MKEAKWIPAQYEKFKNERTQPFIDLMNMVEPVTVARVIDLGCGTGELTQLLHHHLKAEHTTGLDSSPDMLEKAQKIQEQNLNFIKGDFQNWKSSEKFDVILSNAAIQWSDDHPSIFKNIYDSLKDNGQLAVQMPMNHDYPTHTLAREMSRELKWSQLLNGETYNKADAMLSPEDYAKLIFKLGFKDQTIDMKVYGHVLDSREDIIEWVKGSMLSYFRSRLNEEDFAEFLEEYKVRLFKILPDEKPFFYPFKRILIHARR